MAYDPTIPATGHSGSQDYNGMRQNFTQIGTSYNTDHIPLQSGINIGYSNKTTYVEQVSDPVQVATTGIVYTKQVNGNSELFMRKEAGQIIELSLIKAWAVLNLTTLTVIDGYNVMSVTNPALNVIQVNFTTNLANASYGYIGTSNFNAASRTVANFQITTFTPSLFTAFTILILQS